MFVAKGQQGRVILLVPSVSFLGKIVFISVYQFYGICGR